MYSTAPYTVVVPVKADECSVYFLDLGCSHCETGYAVPAMGRRQDLDVVLMCCLQDHRPEVALYGVVDAVLSLVDEQESVLAVGKGQRNTEQAHRAVAKALERNGAGFVAQLHDGSSAHDLYEFRCRLQLMATRST